MCTKQNNWNRKDKTRIGLNGKVEMTWYNRILQNERGKEWNGIEGKEMEWKGMV